MARSSGLDRLLDRGVGIPLIGLAGLLHRRRKPPESPRRIGLIQPTAIGDMVLSSGLLVHLRRRFPEAELHLFHGPSNAALPPLLAEPVIGHCCVFKKVGPTVAELRAAHLDLLIDCTPWTRLSALLSRLSGARATVGFRSDSQHRHFAYDVAVRHSGARHELANLRALAEVFGPAPDYAPALRLAGPPPDLALPYDRLVLMHIAPGGSRARQKSWPEEHWATLIRALAGRGFTIGLTGVAADRAAAEAVLAGSGVAPEQAFSLAGRLDLGALAHVLVRARLLVAVDTGVTHLAGALGAAVVALHGPTRFARWGAWGPQVTGLDAPHPAGGYISLGFERHPQGDAVMAALAPETVLAAVLDRLGRTPAAVMAPDPAAAVMAPDPAAAVTAPDPAPSFFDPTA